MKNDAGVMMLQKLTAKQQRFAEEFLVDLNASQAAIRAGYSARSAYESAHQNMQNPRVRAYLDQMMAKLSRRTGVSQERIVRELARVAFVNAADVIDFSTASVSSQASSDDTAAIAAIKVKNTPTSEGECSDCEIKLLDKLKALELLGKHMGMFTDNVNISADMGVQILNDIPEDSG
ncbi:MAG: terminase small subunit [Bacillota bacterium]|nr:terminase small subunit [Bacillota bacterium]